jgi:hypothetical protein
MTKYSNIIYFILFNIICTQSSFSDVIKKEDIISSGISLLCKTDVCSETKYNQCPSYVAFKFIDNPQQDIKNLKLVLIREKMRQSESWPYDIHENSTDYDYVPQPGEINIYFRPRGKYYARIKRDTLSGFISYSKRTTGAFEVFTGDYDYKSLNFRGRANLECEINPEAKEIIYQIVRKRETERKRQVDKEIQQRRDSAEAKMEKEKKEYQEQLRKREAEINEIRNKRKF